MESNKRFDMSKIKDKVKKFVFTEDALKEMECKEKKPKEKDNGKIKDILLGLLCSAIVFSIGLGATFVIEKIIINRNRTNEPQQVESMPSNNKELEGRTKTIYSEELSKYMIDTINNIYIKVAPTKLDDKVAYSITYSYDIIPEGKMTNTEHFTTGYLLKVLLSGYPYVTYEQMGLQNEEEAYIATQLAIYEIVSRQQIQDVANGRFSLDKIKASAPEYEDMVNRVVSKAKELVKDALENRYISDNAGYFFKNKSQAKQQEDGTTLIGPYYTREVLDDYTKLILGDSNVSTTDLSLKSITGEAKAEIVDKDGNVISKINTGEPFYVRISGSDVYFLHLTFAINSQNIYAQIYASAGNKKQYITVEGSSHIYQNIISLYNKVDYAKLNIDFVNEKGEEITGTNYYIYDEQGNMIQDVDGFGGKNIIELPLGKYYIQQYKTDTDYFVNNNKYEVNLAEKEKEVTIKIQNDSIGNLVK